MSGVPEQELSAVLENWVAAVKRKAAGGGSVGQLGHVHGLGRAGKCIWKAPVSVRELLEDLDNNQVRPAHRVNGLQRPFTVLFILEGMELPRCVTCTTGQERAAAGGQHRLWHLQRLA